MLTDPAALGLIPSITKNILEQKIVDVDEVNQWHCLEEIGQWLENVGQTHLILAIGRQLWARYLEGDRIPTKIGTSQVKIGKHFYIDHRGEIEIGMTWKKIGSGRGSRDCNRD